MDARLIGLKRRNMALSFNYHWCLTPLAPLLMGVIINPEYDATRFWCSEQQLKTQHYRLSRMRAASALHACVVLDTGVSGLIYIPIIYGTLLKSDCAFVIVPLEICLIGFIKFIAIYVERTMSCFVYRCEFNYQYKNYIPIKFHIVQLQSPITIN